MTIKQKIIKIQNKTTKNLNPDFSKKGNDNSDQTFSLSSLMRVTRTQRTI